MEVPPALETMGEGASAEISYARFYASRGAKVAVNDVSAAGAQKVVDEIKGGTSLRVEGVNLR